MPQYQGVWNLQDAARLQSQQQWVTDPNFRNTTLLLQADNAAGGAQNNTFLDSSANNFAITRNGGNPGMTQGTFTPFSQGWSVFTSDRNYLTIPASSDFDLISTDFTVEFFVNVSAFNTMNFSGNNFFGNGLATAVNGWSMGFGGSGTTVTSIEFRTFSSGSQAANTFTTAFSLSTWVHIALVRNGSGSNNLALYVNGMRQGSAQTAVTYSSAGSTFSFGSGSYLQNATYSGNAAYYISNVRLSKTVVYSANFSPPTSPLPALASTTLLICTSNRFINLGTNTGVITTSGFNTTTPSIQPFVPFVQQFQYTQSVIGGSGFFDGTGDFLTVPSTSSLAMGTGDFCIEMWIYPTALSGDQTLYANFASGGGNSQIGIFIRNGNSIRVSSWDTAFLDSAAGTIVGNSWQHIVNCRSGNNSALFINGVRRASTSGTPNNFSSTDAFSIGRRPANDQFFPGYISGLRSVKGSSVYDPTLTTLTIPTAPPTAITNTQLLLNFTNAGIIDGTMDNVVETVGNAQVSTNVVKYGSGSMFFDGTGDNLQFPSSQNFAFDQGDFTIEFWFFCNSASSTAALFDLRNPDTANAGFDIFTSTSKINWGTSGTVYTSNTTTLVNGVWYHLAAVRGGTTMRLYLNGILEGTPFVVTSSQNFTSNTLRIGFGANGYFNGYIDDLRVTKGLARYVANFTPPQVALPRQ